MTDPERTTVIVRVTRDELDRSLRLRDELRAAGRPPGGIEAWEGVKDILGPELMSLIRARKARGKPLTITMKLKDED